MNPAPPVRVRHASLRSVAPRSHPHGRHRNPRRPCGTPHRRAEAVPRPTDTTTQETSMNATTTDTTSDWRTDNDRDSHQRRLADELAADEDTW
jgi:hypothetical protein